MAVMGTDHAVGHRLTSHGLYTDIRGDAAAPALLFLHGGPGQGCHDFMVLQGDLLAASVRLIGLDQRGVDRSLPLPEDAPLTSPGQRDAFRRAAPDHRLLEVAGAGHFVHADEPLQYASAVSEFVLACAGDLSGTGTRRVPATGS
jgi:pimeloyl-ACP methyl ester carboxylesterase